MNVSETIKPVSLHVGTGCSILTSAEIQHGRIVISADVVAFIVTQLQSTVVSLAILVLALTALEVYFY